MLYFLFSIGFLELRWIDVLDIFLVALLIFQLYRLVRGSLAFNILLGLLFVYIASLLVRYMHMMLLSRILGQFAGVGIIAILIVFQPEIRRFLLYLGQSSRISGGSVVKRFSIKNLAMSRQRSTEIQEIIKSLHGLSKNCVGGTIVCAITSRLQTVSDTGVSLNAQISEELIESIFFKNNPLHDGAVVIADGMVSAARCILPLSDKRDLPSHYGLRHRSAIGITEQSDAIALIVSEETGQISYSINGEIKENPSDAEIEQLLLNNLPRHFSSAERDTPVE